jgi:ABC-type polar amino acid transport system ATPase subunit
MLFDEPTSALDPEMKEEVLNVIRRLHDQQMSMIIVTHEVNFIKNVGTRVMLIQDKEVAEENDPKSFFENPKDDRTKKFLRSILNVQ